MATAQTRHCQIQGSIGMDITTKKVVRGTLFTVVMGIVSIYAIRQTQGFVPAIVISYFLSALLVFGVDIERIVIGDKLRIVFETSGDGDE